MTCALWECHARQRWATSENILCAEAVAAHDRCLWNDVLYHMTVHAQDLVSSGLEGTTAGRCR